MELTVDKFDIDKIQPLKVAESVHKRIFFPPFWDYGKLSKPRRISMRHSKFNSYQVENMSELITDCIIASEKVNTESMSSGFPFSEIISEIYGRTSLWDTFKRILDFGCENSFISSGSGTQIAEYIIYRVKSRRFSERIRKTKNILHTHVLPNLKAISTF